MRPIVIAFLIMSPFIALAQNYHLHTPVDALTHAPVVHLAHAMAANASMKMGDMVHAVQALLS